MNLDRCEQLLRTLVLVSWLGFSYFIRLRLSERLALNWTECFSLFFRLFVWINSWIKVDSIAVKFDHVSLG